MIIGMMILFYIFQGFHWWANFELGIHNSTTSTLYNLIIFASAVFVIAIMLILGARVNKQKLTHEFYMEKISEENQRQRDEREKKQNKEAQAAKTAMWVKKLKQFLHITKRFWREKMSISIPPWTYEKDQITEILWKDLKVCIEMGCFKT